MTEQFSHVHWSLCNVNHPYIVVHHWWWYITSIWNQSDIIWRCMGKHWCTAPLITDSATIISIVIDQLLTKHHLSWIILLSHSNQAFKQEVGLIFLRHRHNNHPNYILNYEWLINHFFHSLFDKKVSKSDIADVKETTAEDVRTGCYLVFVSPFFVLY